MTGELRREEVIYEVTLRLDPSIETEFDAWLEHHVREMIRLPGFLGARIHRVEDDGSGELLRTTQYRLSSRAALEEYFRVHAERMRGDGVRRFGDRLTATRRILDAGDVYARADQGAACANCDAPLRGQYCADCGQRARDRMISVWELVKEASEVLTSLDSRLWRTLGLLLFRPGRLTSDYLLGRRARYIPALRLFLGLSLIFFFLFSIDANIGVNGPDAEAGSDGVGLQIHLGDDETEGGEGAVTTDTGTAVRSDPGETPGEPDPGAPASAQSDDGADADHSEKCTDIQVSWPQSLSFMERWLSTDRVTAACEKIVADHGASFGRALLENIPLMMFMFLPVMAFLMKFFYPLTGRYYVEHLLFLVHYHSFFYLAVGLNIVLNWVFSGDPLPETPSIIVFAITTIYIPVYLFRAMRVVYGQGIFATAFKYFLLAVSYLISLALSLAITVTLTAVTL